MGYSASGVAIDQVIEKDVIFIWNAIRGLYLAKDGAWGLSGAGTSTYLGYEVNNGAGGLNDEIGLGSCFIPKDGTYEIHILGTRGTEQGIMHCRLQNNDKYLMDWYDAGAMNKNITKDGTLGALTKGTYTVGIRLASKHASASAYKASIQTVLIYKTP